MQMQTQKILNEIETVKIRLIKIETELIEMEKPSNEDVEALSQAMKEYNAGKLVSFN